MTLHGRTIAGALALSATALVPLLFYRNGAVQEFHLSKALIAALLALGAWSFALTASREAAGHVRITLVTAALAALALWFLASGAWSLVPAQWFGAAFAAAGPLALYGYWKTEDGPYLRRLAQGSVSAAAVVAAIGLLQAGGILPASIDAYGKPDPSSTIGLSNFNAEYLAPLLFLPFALAARTSKASARSVYLVLGLLPLAYIVTAGSRASWLGAVVGVLAGGAIFTRSRALRGALLAGAAAAIYAGAAHFHIFRVATIADESVRLRIETWWQTLKLWGDHPLAGIGLGNFAAAFPPYLTPWLDAANVRNGVFIDHPHNSFLELAAEGGAVGALLLLVLAGALLFALRNACREGDRMFASALGAGLAAQAVTAMLGFPHALAAPLLSFLTAVVLLENEGGKASIHMPARPAALALATLGAVAVFSTAGKAAGEIAYQHAIREPSPQTRWALLSLALRFDGEHADALFKRSNLALQAGDREKATADLRQVLAFAPYEPRALGQLGVLAAQAGDFKAALPLVQQAYANSPGRAAEYVPLLVNLHFDMGDPEGAVRAARESQGACAAKPEVCAALVEALLRAGKPEEARQALDESLRRWPESWPLKALAPRVSYARGNLQLAGSELASLQDAPLALPVRLTVEVLAAKLDWQRGLERQAEERLRNLIARYPSAPAHILADPDLRAIPSVRALLRRP